MHTQTRQYKQLTLGQRYQIQALLGQGHFQKDIAVAIGTSKATLSRELSRNTAADGYCAVICPTNTGHLMKRVQSRTEVNYDQEKTAP